jgi:hypothetical protein
MSIHSHIRNGNLKAFKDSLDVNSLSNEDIHGDTPIEMLVKNFNGNTEINIAILMAQSLINMDADISRIIPYIDNILSNDNLDVNTKKFMTFIKKSKVYKPIKIGNSRGNSTSFQSAKGNKKSNYSAQEELQLKQHAEKLGLSVVNTNHLSLRIITHLMNNNYCHNCSG